VRKNAGEGVLDVKANRLARPTDGRLTVHKGSVASAADGTEAVPTSLLVSLPPFTKVNRVL